MCLLAHCLELIEQSVVEYLEVDPIIIPLSSSDLDRFMHLVTDTRGLSLGDRMLAAQQETALDCIIFASAQIWGRILEKAESPRTTSQSHRQNKSLLLPRRKVGRITETEILLHENLRSGEVGYTSNQSKLVKINAL